MSALGRILGPCLALAVGLAVGSCGGGGDSAKQSSCVAAWNTETTISFRQIFNYSMLAENGGPGSADVLMLRYDGPPVSNDAYNRSNNPSLDSAVVRSGDCLLLSGHVEVAYARTNEGWLAVGAGPGLSFEKEYRRLADDNETNASVDVVQPDPGGATPAETSALGKLVATTAGPAPAASTAVGVLDAVPEASSTNTETSSQTGSPAGVGSGSATADFPPPDTLGGRPAAPQGDPSYSPVACPETGTDCVQQDSSNGNYLKVRRPTAGDSCRFDDNLDPTGEAWVRNGAIYSCE